MPRAAALALLSVLAIRPAWAQESSKPVVDPLSANVPSMDPFADPAEGTNRSSGKGVTPLIAPLPFHNSQIGWGAFLMLGLIHRFDPDTTFKPSTGAIAGFGSENGSWGVMGLEVARFARDRWRARGLVSYMDLKYDYYGIGIDDGTAGQSLPLKQGIFVAGGSLLRRIAEGLYVGPTFIWMKTTVNLEDTTGLGLKLEVPDQSTAELLAPGLQAEYDTRNSDYWPYHGSLAQLKAAFFSTTSGESGSFQRYQAAWSWYNGLKDSRLVLVTNINFCGAPGDAPFYGLCSLGSGRFALRGYTQGRYRDHFANVLQAELRGHTAGRFGATVFGGFGEVAASASDIFSAQLLFAGGAGLRYQLTQKFPMHLRLDYAWGRDGGILYFSVGEAF